MELNQNNPSIEKASKAFDGVVEASFTLADFISETVTEPCEEEKAFICAFVEFNAHMMKSMFMSDNEIKLNGVSLFDNMFNCCLAVSSYYAINAIENGEKFESTDPRDIMIKAVAKFGLISLLAGIAAPSTSGISTKDKIEMDEALSNILGGDK